MSLLSPKLHLSEHFCSLQGEGRTVGVPAIFWRFKGCVLNCVWCDTLEVWKQGTAYTYEELYALFAGAEYFHKLNKGIFHLVITGGDPLLQGDRIAEFLQYCDDRGEQTTHWFIECENQGSLVPPQNFTDWIQLWNISPKLTNSGMDEAKRIVPKVMEAHARRPNAIFKFPVATKDDLLEVCAIIQRFRINPRNVYLMPVSATREEHQSKGAEVAAWCIKEGFNFSPRLQLVLWDKTCGV